MNNLDVTAGLPRINLGMFFFGGLNQPGVSKKTKRSNLERPYERAALLRGSLLFLLSHFCCTPQLDLAQNTTEERFWILTKNPEHKSKHVLL